ncbi:MAG: hypothetical protein AAF961_05050, partial [Planctomycetota bacterium]
GVGLFIALTGCQSLLETPPSSAALDALLKPVSTSPDCVTLEISHVRVAASEAEAVAAIWDRADEMALAADSRVFLTTNGFRVGVVSGAVPTELAALFVTSDDDARAAAANLITDRSANPRVKREMVQIRRHEESPIPASELQPELHVLLSDGDSVTGTSFRTAQPVYALRAKAVTGQRVKLELTPELHHGEMRHRYSGGDQGILLVTPSREREVFDQLLIEADLAPGDLLVLGGDAQADSSLGHVFHHSGLDRGDAKLIIVRAAQVPPSEILADN